MHLMQERHCKSVTTQLLSANYTGMITDHARLVKESSVDNSSKLRGDRLAEMLVTDQALPGFFKLACKNVLQLGSELSLNLSQFTENLITLMH